MIQIPECEEKSSALAQLRRDSNSHQSALQIKFMFKKATSVEKHEDATMVCSTEEVSTPALMEFGAPPFFTPCGPHVRVGSGRDESKFDFSLQAPTTSRNLYRVLRALQVIRRGSTELWLRTWPRAFHGFQKSCRATRYTAIKLAQVRRAP